MKNQRPPKQRVWTKEYLEISRKDLFDNDFLPVFLKFLSIKNNSKILDVGTGLGYIARLLYAENKSIDITGIDINKRLIKLAEKDAFVNKQKIKYAVMDVHSLEYPDAYFDLAIEQTVLINVPEPDKIVKEMIRVVKPGGLIVAIEPVVQYDHHNIYCPNEDNPEEKEAEHIYDFIMDKVIKYRKENGIDEFIAVKLPSLFKSQGLCNVESKLRGKVTQGSPFPNAEKLRKYLEKELAENEKGYSYTLKEAVKAGVSLQVIKKARGMTIKLLRNSLKNIGETAQIWNARIVCQNLLITKGRKSTNIGEPSPI